MPRSGYALQGIFYYVEGPLCGSFFYNNRVLDYLLLGQALLISKIRVKYTRWEITEKYLEKGGGGISWMISTSIYLDK